MDTMTEIRSAVEELQHDAREAMNGVREEVRTMARRLEEERREREELELRMQRRGVAVAGERDNRLREFLDTLMRRGAPEVRGMTIGSDPDGGYTVPVDLDRTIQDQLATISPLRRIAQVATSTSGTYERLIGRRGTTSGWASETTTRTETETPEFAKIQPPGGEVFVNVPVTAWLLEDSLFDLEQYLADHVLTEFAQREGSAFVVGDGLSKPKGFLTQATSTADDDARPFGTLRYTPTGAAADFPTSDPADCLIDLVYSLAPPYRQGAVWLMNSTTAAVVRKFKDEQGRYLWTDGLAAGAPNTLLGYPVTLVEDMPNIGANEYPIAFGNFRRGYLIVDKATMRALRDPYTQKGWVKFYWARRVHGQVTDSNAIRLLKVAAS